MELYNEDDIPNLVVKKNHDSDDLSVVNAARVSFAKEHTELLFTEEIDDSKLINYLARHRHFTPFTHQHFRFKGIDLSMDDLRFIIDNKIPVKLNNNNFTDWSISLFGLVDLFVTHWGYSPPLALKEGLGISIDALIRAKGVNPINLKCYDCYHRGFGVEVDTNFKTLYYKMPIFVARQWFKHNRDFQRNEESRRYISDIPEFLCPTEFRQRPKGSIKQGSSKEIVENNQELRHNTKNVIHSTCMSYLNKIDSGCAPEQARGDLPQWMMTSFWETAHIDDYRRLFGLRISGDAQEETRMYAMAARTLIEE